MKTFKLFKLLNTNTACETLKFGIVVLVLSNRYCSVEGDMRSHLCNTGVAKALTAVVISNDNYADVRDQVARLSSMIDSG